MNNRAPQVAVVDDEDDVRLALRRLLRSAGFDVLAYGSGSEFLRHAARSLPDCVVLDVSMPGPSGFDVQASLQAQGLRIPVVVLTGTESQESRQQALSLGADAYLCKPVDGDALIDAVLNAIAKARSQAGAPSSRSTPEPP
ncbi:MAG TPA: response regulator [Stenotrophomonas sp.]|jgi:FixJ family two-component response regulator